MLCAIPVSWLFFVGVVLFVVCRMYLFMFLHPSHEGLFLATLHFNWNLELMALVSLNELSGVSPDWAGNFHSPSDDVVVQSVDTSGSDTSRSGSRSGSSSSSGSDTEDGDETKTLLVARAMAWLVLFHPCLRSPQSARARARRLTRLASAVAGAS